MRNSESVLIFYDAILLTEDVVQYSFCLSANSKFSFVPGQYLELLLENGKGLERRDFSISSIPEDDHIAFAVKKVKNGFFSNALDNLKSGDKIMFRGPFGGMMFSKLKDAVYLLIGTGTGVAPFRSLIRSVIPFLNDYSLKIIVLVGSEEFKKVPYIDEFIGLAKEYSNFELKLCYGAQRVKSLNFFESSNSLKDEVTRQLNLNAFYKVFISANPQVSKDIREYLLSHHYLPDNILSDY